MADIEALREALTHVDNEGFGDLVDADSIIVDAAHEYLALLAEVNSDGLAASHYGTTLTIGDTKLTLTPAQVNDWNELGIIYPCQPGQSDHGWHLDPETCP